MAIKTKMDVAGKLQFTGSCISIIDVAVIT